MIINPYLLFPEYSKLLPVSVVNKKTLKVWINAARPQTLTAAFVPVLVGAALAIRDNSFNWIASGVALICAFLIQIGTNFANDYFDHIKGADTEERIGFERATAAGLISEDQMKTAAITTMVLAFMFGLYLVWHAGWVIFALGVASLLCGVLYTGGPFPLGYHGLGDVFVFLFFGMVAVMGTYYVNALEWSVASLWASLSIGALATNILVVNNLRDVEQDRPAGKNTLGVLFGERALHWEYIVMMLLALAVPLYFYMHLDYEITILLPFLTAPFGGYLLYTIWTETDKSRLNTTLKQTARFMTLFGMLFSVGIILG